MTFNKILTSGYIAPELNSIRTELEKMNDNTPFLLFPMQVETRYKTMEQPLNMEADPVDFSNLICNISKICLYNPEDVDIINLIDYHKKLIKAANNSIFYLNESIELVNKLNILSYGQVERLKETYADILDNINYFINVLAGFKDSAREIVAIPAINEATLEELTTEIIVLRYPIYEKNKKLRALIDNCEIKIITQLEEVDELWVRFFPDDIAVNSHETLLTQKEVEAGKKYWEQIWQSRRDKELELGAWRAISASYGKARAAWIVKNLLPINITSRPVHVSNSLYISFQKTIDLFKEFDNIRIYDRDIIIANKEKDKGSRDSKIPTSISLSDMEKESIIYKLKLLEESLHLIENMLDFDFELEFIYNKYLSYTEEIENRINQLFAQITIIESVTKESFTNRDIFYKVFLSILHSIKEKIRYLKIIDKINYNIKIVFPIIDKTKDSSWEDAPISRVMPDKFVVMTTKMKNGKEIISNIVVGNDIPNPLIMGFDPNSEETSEPENDFDLGLDSNLKWLSNFENSVNDGMGVIIPLEKNDDNNFKKVIVLGVKSSLSSTEAKLEIENLFQNHLYLSKGMSFLPIGTPTNNTEDKPTKFKTVDYELLVSYMLQAELHDDTVFKGEHTDGKKLSKALGLDSDIFNHIEGNNNYEIDNALSMNKIMFSGTLKLQMAEFFDKLFTKDTIDNTKEFVTNYVLSRGFLPSLRIGSQPYGILPTTAFSLFKTLFDNKEATKHLSSEEIKQIKYYERLKELLFFIRNLFEEQGNNKILHSDSENISSKGTDNYFLQMLGLHATSIEYFSRYGFNSIPMGVENLDRTETEFGPTQFYNDFKSFIDTGSYDDEITDNQERVNKSQIFKINFLEDFQKLYGPVIDFDKDNLSETETLKPNITKTYIDWLLNEELETIVNENNFEDMPSKSLLFLMLRQALLHENLYTALDILKYEGIIDNNISNKVHNTEQLIEEETPDLDKLKFSKWDYLFTPLPKIIKLGFVADKFQNTGKETFYEFMSTNGYTMAQYLFDSHVHSNYPNKKEHADFIKKLANYRYTIKNLKNLPTEKLFFLLTEHLDICSYRLDAWLLGLVNHRLTKQREEKSAGINIGAFGWIENLERKETLKTASSKNIPDELKSDDNSIPYIDPTNLGFIHAPSFTHAITSAILRNGYNEYTDNDKISSKMAVNLSSERVRRALNVVDGVNNGQRLGELLGYQFEKNLIEKYSFPEIMTNIINLREKFVFEYNNIDDNMEIPENHIINGLDFINFVFNYIEEQTGDNLLDKITDDYPYELVKELLPTKNSLKKAFIKEIFRLADTLDAIGDLCMSESIYQVTQGNYIRAASILTKMSEGKNPEEFQILATPRTGTVVSQKALLNFKPITLEDASSETNTNNWKTEFTSRAIAEPTLNNWLGEVLPALNLIKVQYSIGNSSEINTFDFDLLGIQVIDLYYLVNDENGSELINFMIEDYLRNNNNEITDDLEIKLEFKATGIIEENEFLTLYEVIPLIENIKEMISKTRTLSRKNLLLPNQNTDNEGYDFEDLIQRCSHITENITNILNVFCTIDEIDNKIVIVYNFDDSTDEPLITLLKSLSLFGVPQTFPKYGDFNIDKLRNKAHISLNSFINKYKQYLKYLEQDSDTLEDRERFDLYASAIKAVFGEEFIFIPHFHFKTISSEDDIFKAVQQRKNLLSSNNFFAIDTWHQTISKVREKMSSVEAVSILSDVLTTDFLQTEPVQLPFNPKDKWVGTEFEPINSKIEDKLSLVFLNFNKFISSTDLEIEYFANNNFAGLVIDEWTEIIPDKEVTTGVSFHYDQPEARPPQSILLAVTPEQTGKWNFDHLIQTVVDTMEIAKLRAIEPEHIENKFAQLLPGTLSETQRENSVSFNYLANNIGIPLPEDAENTIPISEL